ncbi:maturation of Asn-linked oligosaccharides protein [Pseudocyphellaria aurata]|nr:maturation of Asn-linked oligosaccharides protein [Pseudocyphellaria aurata]
MPRETIASPAQRLQVPLSFRASQGAIEQDPIVRSRAGAINRERADAVKETFQFAWDGYSKYCFGEDELQPVTNTCGRSRNGWGATAIDALSTALVMQIDPIVNKILEFVPTIDFTKTEDSVSLFETTIRYLGGLLSAYDLLQGPLADLASNSSAVDELLVQAKSLADTLKYAFDTPSGVPYNNLVLSRKSNDGATSNGLATTGTLVLEWQRLSDITGDPEYGRLAQKAESHLLNPLPEFAEPFPGLLGTNIDIETGKFTDSNGGWNGGDDSFYEYLIKMYAYDSSRYSQYRDRWILAANSTIEYLTSHPASRPDLTFLASFQDTALVYSSQHLTCFDGGNFLLGGEILKRQDLIDFGLALVNGCHETYDRTATSIGPESFSWDTRYIDESQREFFDKSGFYITNGAYVLRPEVVESYYYAFRITGDSKYQDWAWDAFVAINATTRTSSGFTSISDVNAPGGGQKYNNQESFFFAEVLKYSYLIHAPDAPWQTNHNGVNEFIYNTEAHPLRVAGASI